MRIGNNLIIFLNLIILLEENQQNSLNSIYMKKIWMFYNKIKLILFKLIFVVYIVSSNSLISSQPLSSLSLAHRNTPLIYSASTSTSQFLA